MAGKINVGVLVSIVRRMILGLIIINKVIHIREERCELGLYSETRKRKQRVYVSFRTWIRDTLWEVLRMSNAEVNHQTVLRVFMRIV